MANTKYNRRYQLQVGTSAGILTVELPFTIEFDITRNTLTSANVCQIRVYNLNKFNRNLIRFNISNFGGPYRPVILRAGYGDNLAVIFSGNISQAWSVREGTNYITQIECYDGGFAFVNGETNRQFSEGTPTKQVIETLIKDLPNTEKGAVGNFSGTLPRANSYSGNTAQILNQITNNNFFIDSGKAYALKPGEYYKPPGGLTVINAASGILNTPVLEQTIVRFDMLFEPNLNCGSAVKIESISEEAFNGVYKITAVKHRGTISSAVAGKCITSGEFFYNQILSPVG